MYRQETIKPYNQKGEKGQQVEAMFDNIAPTYDMLNHRLSWDIDKYWRRKAIRLLTDFAPKTILDIATGTGDFAIQAAKASHQPSPEEGGGKLRIVGCDISDGMMAVGREKVRKLGLADVVRFEHEDCMNLSYASDSFDAVTAAFGIRNFPDLEKGLSEMCRVLRSGGAACIIELTTPVSFPMKQLFHIYSHLILPTYGKMISKDRSAYSYLTKTIEAFPQGEKMMEIMKSAGFKEARFERLTFGICTLYTATK